ncbi:MAG: CoA-binding protein, partial [Kiritimatiellia bacterium]|nr:CoA-binding protein [Kiritimatiellia bacterium]
KTGVGLLSNAGYEAVGMADQAGPSCPFELPVFAPETLDALQTLYAKMRIDTLVDIRNPLDVTPMAADEGLEQVVRTLLSDPGVDIGVIGVVPLTGALTTQENLSGDEKTDGSDIAGRLIHIWNSQPKPFLVSIDSGRLYDRMAEALTDAGIPVFREADAAVRALAEYLASRFHDSQADAWRSQPSL